MTDAPADALHDAEMSLIEAGIDPGMVRKILVRVRARWQGRSYIRSISRDPSDDAEIERRLAAGEHPRDIAKAVGKHRTSIVRRRSNWL